MAVLRTSCLLAYDRHVVETVHGVQNLVVANTYHAVEPHPAGWLEIITAIPYGFERAAGVVVLTFMVGACMGLIKRAGLIDLGVQRLAQAVGQSEFLVAPVLMLVLRSSQLLLVCRNFRSHICRFSAALL